jgi:4-diphosphocytidyl-2C-methyl-D-erythritol kinase
LRDNSHGSLLCGSGAAVFAIADGTAHAKELADKIMNNFNGCSVWTAETVPYGCTII